MPVLVEMGWGGRVTAPGDILWTDITRRVDQVQGVTITRGASDELADTQPGTASLTLDNLDGALTPGNPDSPFFPNVRRNAPIRISQAVMPVQSGSAPYPMAMLADDFDEPTVSSFWTTAGGAGAVNGLMRLPAGGGVASSFVSAREWKLTGSQLTAKLVTVPADGGSSSVSISMYIHSATSGTRLRWYYNARNGQLRAQSDVGGSDASPTTLTYSPIDHAWLRIRETSGTVYWETSGDGYEWTVQRSLARPAWVASDTHQVEFAAYRLGGIPDVAEFDLVGAVVRPRFYGMVNEWPVQWEGLLSSVSISATDMFKRINRAPVLRSMAAEEILRSGPQAFYPLTDPAGAASAGNVARTFRPALTITQVGVGGTLDPGTVDGPPATGEQVPLFTPSSATVGRYLSVDILNPVPPSDPGHGTPDGDLLFECWFQTSTQGRVMMSWLDGEPVAFENSLAFSLESGTGKLKLETRVNNVLTSAVATTANLADGAWHHLVYSNATAVQTAWVDGVSYTLASSTASSVRLLHVGSYKGTGLWSGSVSHVAVYADTGDGPFGHELAAHFPAGTTGYDGETADVRITRLASYAGVNSVTIQGTLHDQVASQGPGGTAVMARMREVESTESGRLYAERDYYGLCYQSRDLRYNPDSTAEVFTIAYADLETADVQLADDDQKLCNYVEGSRPGGAVQVVADQASIDEYGVYPQQLNLLKTTDSSVLDAASWIVTRYADPEPELREVPVEAHTMPEFIDILDADISSYFTVYDLPAQSSAPELRCTVEGYTETLAENSHVIRFRTSASSRDSVWILDDPVYSILDSTTRLAY